MVDNNSYDVDLPPEQATLTRTDLYHRTIVDCQ